jgi:hypothetical protein
LRKFASSSSLFHDIYTLAIDAPYVGRTSAFGLKMRDNAVDYKTQQPQQPAAASSSPALPSPELPAAEPWAADATACAVRGHGGVHGDVFGVRAGRAARADGAHPRRSGPPPRPPRRPPRPDPRQQPDRTPRTRWRGPAAPGWRGTRPPRIAARWRRRSCWPASKSRRWQRAGGSSRVLVPLLSGRGALDVGLWPP